MTTESLKVQYLRQQVDRGIREIFAAQVEIAARKISHSKQNSRTGALMDSLRSPRYTITQSGEGVEAHVRILTYMRFMDMRKVGNWKIYNRQVWGILYHDVRARVRYEFEDFIARQREQLQQSLSAQ